jgi:hypothetical protein
MGVCIWTRARVQPDPSNDLVVGETRLYRRVVPASRTTRCATGATSLALVLCCSCTSVDPGPNFSAPAVTFDKDYFYCHVEPELIVAKRCGPGDSSIDSPNSCHFTASAVSGMVLIDHPPVDCGGGDHPVNLTQVGMGGPAQANFEWVSLEMSKDAVSAPLFVRPSGSGGVLYHPRRIFASDDQAVITLLTTWASK